MYIKLFTEFRKEKMIHYKTWLYGRLIFLLWYEVKSLKALELPPFNTSLPRT